MDNGKLNFSHSYNKIIIEIFLFKFMRFPKQSDRIKI